MRRLLGGRFGRSGSGGPRRRPAQPGPGPGPTAGTVAGGLLVPLYVHPAADPDAWRALPALAGQLYGVVLNAADGPGPRPDAAFREAAARLRAAGVTVLGYADTAYGRRPVREVLADVHRHRAWYGVDGVFIDQAAAVPELLPRYSRLARTARGFGARTVVLNPGVHPAPGYARIADCLVTFEGDWETYRTTTRVPEWTRDHPPHRFCHLVYAVPDGCGTEVARLAHAKGAAVHCAVPGNGANPWQHVPPPGPPGGGGS